MPFIVLALLCQLYNHQIEAKASIVGCVTNKQAETIFEEISKMFDNVALFDTIDELFKNEVSENSLAAIKRCDPGFEERYSDKTQTILQFAMQAENNVNEANENRIKQVEVGRVYEDTWKKLRRLFKLHEKFVYAFDIFLKDNLMQKSARISQDIRSGNNGDIKWNTKIMKEHLLGPALLTRFIVSKLPDSMLNVLKSVFRQLLITIVASQFDAAVSKSDWEVAYSLQQQTFYRVSRRFSELKISKDLRHAAKLRYNTMVVGVEEAEEYSKTTNSTLETVRAAIEKLNSASVYNSCDKNKQLGAEIINELTTIATSLEENEVKFAAEYLAKINDFYRNTFKPIMAHFELNEAMTVIKDTLPEIRSPALEQTHYFLRNFLDTGNIYVGSLYPHWFLFLNKTEEVMNTMVEYAECQANVVQVLGNIFQDCVDGKGSFDEIHERVTAKITFDEQDCLEKSTVELAPKEEIRSSFAVMAESLTPFDADCTKNRPSDDVPHRLYKDDPDNDDADDDDVLSPSQRFTVCDLKNKHGLTENAIADKIKMRLGLIQRLRCPNTQERDKLFDHIRKSQPMKSLLIN